MTNTINNVPRELLENIVLCYNEGEFELGTLAAECHALLSATSPAGVDGWDVAGDILKKLSAAQAIIDGLRGEVADLGSMLATVSKAGLRVRTERDQQARRIVELEGLLLRVQVSLSLDDTEWGYSGAEKYKLLADIRAALAAGKEKQDEHN